MGLHHMGVIFVVQTMWWSKDVIEESIICYCKIILWYFVVASLAVMSIDLGNEYIKIGLVKPGVPMEIVLNT